MNVDEIIRKQLPKFRENLRLTFELDRKIREAGIPLSAMPPILIEAHRILGSGRRKWLFRATRK